MGTIRKMTLVYLKQCLDTTQHRLKVVKGGNILTFETLYFEKRTEWYPVHTGSPTDSFLHIHPARHTEVPVAKGTR